MPRVFAVALAIILAVAVAPAAPAPQRPAGVFLVQDGGLVLLQPDGQEKERLGAQTTNGALSADGRWLAYVEFDKKQALEKLVIRRRHGADQPVTLPLVWGSPAQSGCLPVWAPDSRRVLIGENRPGQRGGLEYAYRVYELATGKLTERQLPDGHWVADWSRDGKRFLTTARLGGAAVRIAWVNADGSGEPEFLSPEGEVAYDARLSPDGRRMLYKAAGPRPPNGQRARMRLYVMDLASRKRTAVDEPGETDGYCWSPDGSRVAYTWQRSPDQPGKGPDRETLLITCDPDGGNQKTIASRKCRPVNANSVVYFFWVLDWR
jgi:Tol biopolymer transport system component